MISSSLKKFAEPLGFENKNGRLFGEYQGYCVTLAEGMGHKKLTIGVTISEGDPLWNQVVGFIETNRNESQIENFTLHSSHIAIMIKDTFGTMKRLANLLDKTVKMLEEAKIPGNTVCWYCKNAFTSPSHDRIQLNDAIIPMHSTCIENYNDSIQQATQEFRNQPKNYARGFLGALLGGIIGVIPWVIVYLLGFFVGLLGLVIGFAAKKGYEILGGRPGKAKKWIIVIVVIFSVCLGQFISENISFYNALQAEGITEFAFLDLPSYIIDLMIYEPGYQREVLGSVIMGLFFAFLGIFDLFRVLKHEGKGSFSIIKKVN